MPPGIARQSGKEPRVKREEAEAIVRDLRIDDPVAFFNTGLDLLDADYAELLASKAREAAVRWNGDARLHQLSGLAARAVGDSRTALAAFSAAARLAPDDALIAHSHARAALEAGVLATALFDRTRRLAPQDGSVLLGLAAAQVQDGQVARAVNDLAQIVRENPMWLDGQRSLAHLLGQNGDDPLSVIDSALRQLPRQADLHHLAITILLEARDLDRAAAAAGAAARQIGAHRWLTLLTAHIASEQGLAAEADHGFQELGAPEQISEASLLARHLIRCARPEAARDLLDRWIARDRDHMLWPYLSLAWRLTGDPRWDWLEGEHRLVGVYDLADSIGDIAGLADHLRALHFATGAPLDQSVRGGTQTDGNLLLRDEPPLRALRAVIEDTVARHVAQLPSAREGHPTLLRVRAPRRIVGSWSVRLGSAGFHVDHVHGQGWISSALYVVLPDSLGSDRTHDDHAGWLSLGECRELVPGLEPVRLVEPRPGRLVLFPSTMWHGTRAFPAGERMTVAFDIAKPKQSRDA